MQIEREEELKQILDNYGVVSQMNVAIEEMSELIKELCKYNREETPSFERVKHIIEEMADTQIMLNQLRLIFGNDHIFEYYYDLKINRQKERIEKEGNNG